jgi:hypothetical protein
MGQVINISEAGTDYVLYGDKGNVISNYLYNQMQSLPKAFNEFSERVYNNILSSYNYVNDKLTQYGILNEIQNSGINIVDNYYQELLTFQQLQQANFTMQRWVMAHPQVREMYVKQDIDGYSETYKNVFGKDVGEADYNHRLVMDGVITSTDDHWVVKHYIGDLLPGDRELTHMEKTTILNTWEAVNHMLRTSDFDFTCNSGQPVKFNKE